MKNIIIAGPCAVESEVQIEQAISEAQKRKIDFMRMCLWKPRTKPGFEGLGKKGLKFLAKAAKKGVNPGTEVLTPEHAKEVIHAVLEESPKSKILLWIGARNQNHLLQRKIGKVASKDRRVYLMVKNQPWLSEDHWEGIVSHVFDGGMEKDRVIICHRGFTPNGHNPHGYRNMPDFEMAMRIKQKTGVPIVFDPSHTGGSVENVFKLTRIAKKYDFDGMIVEVHHNPGTALTDAKQQLNWRQFDQIIQI